MGIIKRNFRRLNIYSGLPKSIYILAIVRVVNAMGNFVYPFLTLFLTQHIGFSTEKAGVYFMVSAFAQIAGSLFGGKLTDKFGRKRLYMILQGLAACCYAPCAFLGESIIIVYLLMLAGFLSSAAQPANSAMMADLTHIGNRKQAYSLLYLGVNLGFSIGPTIAGFLYKNYTWLIFFGNTVSIIITLILLAVFVEDTIPSKNDIENSKKTGGSESAEDSNAIAALIKRPVLLLFLIGMTVNSFVYSSIRFVLPLQLTKFFGDDLGPKYFGYMMSANGITIILLTTFIIKLTIKIKPIINVSLASLFFAAGLGMLGYVNTFPLYILAAVLYTIGEILEATNCGVYIANHSPINQRGRFNSAIPLITGIGTSAAPYVFGKFMTAYDNTKLWTMCFIIALGASIFLRWLGNYETIHNKTAL